MNEGVGKGEGAEGGITELESFVGNLDGRWDVKLEGGPWEILGRYRCWVGGEEDGEGEGGERCEGEAGQSAYYG